MHTVSIEADRVAAAAALIPDGQPVVMINLLRYRAQADYGERKDQLPCTGREAYFDRYAPVATGIVLANGGRVFWLGKVLATVVGPAEEQWHDALLVEYPDFECLQRVFREPAYQAIVFHRTAALEDSRLIATATLPGLG